MKYFLAGRLVEEVEVITPFGKQTVNLKILYPGKDFVGYLPVFASEESTMDEGGMVCSLTLNRPEKSE